MVLETDAGNVAGEFVPAPHPSDCSPQPVRGRHCTGQRVEWERRMRFSVWICRSGGGHARLGGGFVGRCKNHSLECWLKSRQQGACPANAAPTFLLRPLPVLPSSNANSNADPNADPNAYPNANPNDSAFPSPAGFVVDQDQTSCCRSTTGPAVHRSRPSLH